MPSHIQRLEQRQLFNAYYFNTHGSDSLGDGSINHPWASIARANLLHLVSGDQLLFDGGQTFAGGLVLDPADVRGGAKPLVVSSFGNGPAILTNTTGDAIEVHDLADINLSNLTLIGPGRNFTNGDGIHFVNDLPAGSILDHVAISNLQISGFVNGIEMNAIPLSGVGKCGYSNVAIMQSILQNNGDDGLFLQGNFSQTSTQYSFTHVLISHVIASSNYHTVAGVNDENGIDVSDSDNAVIQYCTACNNARTGDGEVGIWTWDSNRSVIQYCIASGTRTGHGDDGDGFDLDGGDTNSILQNNISSGNDGTGYALFQFKYARPFYGNIIRNNVSMNDGRKNAYGGIDVGNYGTGISNCQIYQNIVVMNAAVGARPSAVQLETPTTDLRFFNNTFVVGAGVPLLSISPGQTQLQFYQNDYYSAGTVTRDL